MQNEWWGCMFLITPHVTPSEDGIPQISVGAAPRLQSKQLAAHGRVSSNKTYTLFLLSDENLSESRRGGFHIRP